MDRLIQSRKFVNDHVKIMSVCVGEESFYICNVSDIINKHKIWKQWLQRVIPMYFDANYIFSAVKCNDSKIFIQTLALLGDGFDCASLVMDCGVAANSIIFANPTKLISHLNFAAEMGVSLMTFDCDYELHKYPAAE